ncbi:MAG: DUF6603 domain-containing protein [Hydrogenophaga sp.]|uniref:DUF6603 domain-containing protein n=1 Tax=Hydrogenophaga sp. TaxID=1904254 RepID=UPI003D0F6B6C
MSASFASDALDPVVRQVGEVAGLLRSGAGDSLEFNEAFARDPAAELARALSERQEEVIELLSQLMGQTDGEVLGLPAAGDDDRWIPIRRPDGDTGLYLVMRSAEGRLFVGVGWKWSVTEGDLVVSLWAHVPLLSSDGTGPGTRVEIASAIAPLRLAADVSLRNGFGTAGLAFRGVRGSVSITGIERPPDVALVLLGLQLPGEAAPRDRSLADLINLPGSAWIETAVALFTAQLRAAGDAGADRAAAVVDELLPLLGISAPAGRPRLRWEDLPARGAAVFDDWFLALVTTPGAMVGWLGHWQGLLRAGVGAPVPIAVEGAGTRADPWRVGVRVAEVEALVTAAVETQANGQRLLYLGLRAGSTPIPLAGPLRLVFGGAAEVVAIPIGGPGALRALPSLSVGLTLASSTGSLVDHTFGAGDPLAALARLRVGSLQAGFGLDASGQPAPVLQLRGVECARGSWPLLDLSSADAVIDGLGAVVGNAIQQQIEQGLGLLDSGTHAGRRIAALIGLVPPSAFTGTWPVPLLASVERIAQFLGDPLGAIGRYHASALVTDTGGVPAWRHLLMELGGLLRIDGAAALPLRGSGSAADPWRLELAATDAGAVVLRAETSLASGRPQLRLAAAFEPRSLQVDGVQLSFAVLAELLHLDLAPPAGTGAAQAVWLPLLRAELRLHGVLQTPSLAGLRLSAQALGAALEWRQVGGVQWRVALNAPGARWLAGGRAIALPDLVLDASGMAGWALDAPDLGGALGAHTRDAVAELAQYVLGHLMLEHGGPAGFGLSALLGLLPEDPGIALPAWRGGETGIALSPDFPRLQPADWGTFFANPAPALRAHLAAVLANPRHALPLLRWLGLALQGLAPARTREGELLTFEQARNGLGDFPLDPALESTDAPESSADAPLSLPRLEDLPFTLEGAGTYEQPYALGLRAPAARGVQGLVWLDPDGPPDGDALAVAIATLAPALRDLGALSLAQLAPALDVLSRLDAGIADALSGVLPASLGTGLAALEDFLSGSDGLVLSASQVPPAASGWSAPIAPLAASHVHALSQAEVVAEIRRQVLAWDVAGTAPVLMLGAPFANASAWLPLQTALGGSTASFTFRVAGTAPDAVSTAPLAGTARLTAAELAVWNDAPGTAPSARAVPLDASAGSSSQAEQVARLVQRIAQARPGERIVVVAHSASGLAARAALQRAGIAPLVRGLITVGTPHIGTPLPWLANPPLAEALAALQRLGEQVPLPNGGLRDALDALWGFVRERAPDGVAWLWPAQAFSPVGGLSLPAGVDGHAIGLHLPQPSLGAALAASIAARAQQLRDAQAARAPVSHIGFGLALAPAVTASEGALRLRTQARLDLARVQVAAGTRARSLPRLELKAELWRSEGWLVGGANTRVRVRRAELGCEVSETGIVPVLRLVDVAVDGVQLPLATLRRIADGGPWVPDDLLVPALDALLAQLTSGAGRDASVVALARLLARVELTKLRAAGAADDSAGYAIHPEGWASLLADAPAWLARELAAVWPDPPRREALVAQLRTVFGLGDNDLSRLLLEQASDEPAWRALRTLLQSLDLLEPSSRGAMPRLQAWLALLRDPVAWLTAQVRPLLADATRRQTLLTQLRNLLDVRDVGGHAEAELPLGGGVSLHVQALGRVALRFDTRLAGALTLGGDVALELSQGSAQVALRVQPDAVSTGLTFSMDLPAGAASAHWGLAIDFGDGTRTAPYAALPLVPLPPDLPARLGELLPRLTLTTLASALLDGVVLPRVPELAGVLQALGLASRGVGAERARVRNLARVVADPLGWLQSEATLFRVRAAGTGIELDPARVIALTRDLFTTFGLTDSAGDVHLPLNLRLRGVSAPQARLQLETTAPIALEGGVTLGGAFQLGWSAAGSFGAGGSLSLVAPLPAGSPWGSLVVQAGMVDDAFTLALGPEGAPIQLLPFAGFDASTAGALAERLLPTLIDATLRALSASGDAAVATFVTQLRNAAAALQVDSAARLQTLVDDPVLWMRGRFSAVNAPASVGAIAALIPGGAHITAVGGELRFAPPGSPVVLGLGRAGAGIGLGVELNVDLGPVTLTGELAVGLNDAGTPAPEVTVALGASVDEGVIEPGGVSIRPSLGLEFGTGAVSLWLYPIGNVPGSPDFRLDVLPSFAFGVDDGGSIEDALLALARRVLVPVAVETVLDTAEVTGWLNSDLGRGVRPGPILQSAGLLVDDGASGWNLVAIDELVNDLTDANGPVAVVERLIGAALETLASAFDTDPVVDFGIAGSGLFVHREGSSAPRLYGLRVCLPELRLGDDPEIIVRLGGDTDWVAAAGGPASTLPGLSLLLLKDSGGGHPRFQIEPVIELAGVGIDVSGRADEPLFDLGGFQLGGVESLLFLRLELPLNASPRVKFGVYGDLEHIAIPLGSSDSNPVAQSLMSGSGGDSAPVNPRFSVRAAYIENFWLELGDTPGRNEVWFPIQRTFGPVSIQQIGIRWIGGPDLKGAILLDGGVALAGLAVGVDDLSLTIPFADMGDLSKWELGLRGLAVSYDGGGVRIGGGLLQADLGDSDDVRYDGFLLVEVGGRSFVALGSYGVVNGDPSLFVFVVIGIPIGGPPYFFITGLAGGFGYNRGLVVPAIEGLPQFPLVAAMSDASAVTAAPMDFLQRMGPAVPMERGSYWFAAGLKFSSFALVNSQALLYVLLNRGLEIGLLGMSKFELPPAVPLVSVELALKARFSTIEGVISVEARLTDNSWVLSRDCRLTGGFAFFIWFAGEHAGDFVITIGGYHPRYTPPDHYPVVPRLGFNWRVSSCISIKGEAYFALTPRQVMAGGLLEAVYDSGDVRAWFRAWANMYIQWRPFWFEVEIGISIGVSVDTWLGRVKIETGASLIVWGPEIGGEVTIDVFVISITIPFGADRVVPQEVLSWDQFRTALLPPEDEKLFAGGIERGLVSGSPSTGPWSVLPEFVIRTESFIGASEVRPGSGGIHIGARGTLAIDIKPMNRTGVASVHHVRVLNHLGQDVTHRFQVCEALSGNVARALWDTDTGQPERSVIPAYTGMRLVAEIDRNLLDHTGAIPWEKLFDTGTVHPLPFARELDLRHTVTDWANASLALDAHAAQGSQAIWQAQQTVLASAEWKTRRSATLQALSREGVRVTPSNRSGDAMPRGSFRPARRSAPPLVRSLHEGLAAQAVTSVETKVVAPPADTGTKRQRIVPVLDAVIRQRVEPTLDAEANIRTTVSSKRKEALRLDARQMATLLAPPLAGAVVILQGAASEPRATGLAMAAPKVMRSGTSSARETAWLDAVGRAALRRETSTDLSHRSLKARSGAPLDPGSTLRFALPTRDTEGAPPMLEIAGDGAARITVLDRGGVPLLDVETVGKTRQPWPEGASVVAVTGLGRVREKRRQPTLGAVTLAEATRAVPVVGWQSHSELVALTDTTLLARGALLRLSSSAGVLSRRGTVRAHEAVSRQTGLETLLPVGVRSVVVVLDDGPGEPSGDLASSLGLSVRNAELASEPVIIAAGSRTVLVYEVQKSDVAAPWIEISLAFTTAWSVCGVMGLQAAPDVWVPLLAESELDTLVEDGPLSAIGSLRLHFTEH